MREPPGDRLPADAKVVERAVDGQERHVPIFRPVPQYDAAEPAVAQEACLGIVDLCKRGVKGASKEVRKKALTVAAQKLKHRRAKKDAQNMLRGLK